MPTDKIWEKIQRESAEFEKAAAKTGLYHRGYRFWPPYACGRCGEPISARQFAFSRSCGGCDSARSRTARLSIFDPRWFLLGKAELENPKEAWLIAPEFLPAHTRGNYPLMMAPPPRPHPRIPIVPKVLPKPTRPGGA